MMTKMTFSAGAIALVFALPLSGCSKTPSETIPPAGEQAAHEGHEGHHGKEGHEGEHKHGATGGPVDKFHEQLAPLWHAPEGAQRVTDTCAAAGSLHGGASEIVAAGAPTGAAPDFLDAAQKLVAAAEALHAECGTPERKEFGTKFATLHDAFHAVAERAGQ